VPLRHRAIASALVGMAPNVGGVIGLILVTSFTNTRVVSQGYLLMAGASAFCVLLFLIIFREPPLAREAVKPFHVGSFLIGFLRPLLIRDFAYTLLSRTLAFVSFTLLGTFLLYSLEKRLHLAVPVAARGVTLFQLLSTILLFIAALITGFLSERVQRLKPFVIVGALVMALGLLLLALVPDWWGLWTAAAIFGIGYGVYLGVDVALAVRVLPSEADRGKDLGLLYTATFLSLILSPTIGALVLNMFGSYQVLFIVAAVSSLLAAASIVPIKSVQ
jgi:MFS family permease